MTAFTVSDDATGGSGGLSANAMALAADTNLIFTLTPDYQIGAAASLGHDGLLTINRRMRLSKIAAASGARVGSTVLPTVEILGNLRLQRGSQVAAQFNFSIPPSGQIPAPTGSAALVKDSGSTIGKDVTRKWKFAGIRKDASGSTPIGSVGSEIWLGAGSTRITPSFQIFLDDRPEYNDLDDSVGVEITVVPYDKLADKEGAPVNLQLTWNLGPFVGDSTSPPGVSDASGNLPAGTIVNVRYVRTFADGSMITQGSQNDFTIGASGGCSFNPSGYAGYLEAGNTTVYSGTGILYKLSTHSSWTFVQGNQNVIVANTFSPGGVSLPAASRTFPNVAYVDMFLNTLLPFGGTDLRDRFDMKVFCGGRQVQGVGSQYLGSGFQWKYDVEWSIDNGSSSFATKPHIRISSAYDNSHQNYAIGAPRGDQFYVAGEKSGFDININPRFGVTDIEIYAATATANSDNGQTVGGYGAWQLIYSGPYVATFRWLGVTLGPATYPSVNTTASYSLTTGVVNWDASDAAEIIVEPGDQLIAACTSGSFGTANAVAMVQLSMPVEFIS